MITLFLVFLVGDVFLPGKETQTEIHVVTGIHLIACHLPRVCGFRAKEIWINIWKGRNIMELNWEDVWKTGQTDFVKDVATGDWCNNFILYLQSHFCHRCHTWKCIYQLEKKIATESVGTWTRKLRILMTHVMPIFYKRQIETGRSIRCNVQ